MLGEVEKGSKTKKGARLQDMELFKGKGKVLPPIWGCRRRERKHYRRHLGSKDIEKSQKTLLRKGSPEKGYPNLCFPARVVLAGVLHFTPGF